MKMTESTKFATKFATKFFLNPEPCLSAVALAKVETLNPNT